jgi:hypothetical protein
LIDAAETVDDGAKTIKRERTILSVEHNVNPQIYVDYVELICVICGWTYSLSRSLVVCSVTLGGWASSFVLTCCRPRLGIGMLVVAGGSELRVDVDPKADV